MCHRISKTLLSSSDLELVAATPLLPSKKGSIKDRIREMARHNVVTYLLRN